MRTRLTQITNPALEGPLSKKSGEGFLAAVIPALIGLFLLVGALIFLFTLITGAISWMTAGGDKQKVEEARGRITNGIVGLIILLATFALVGVLENFFGINILTLDFGPLKIR